MKKLVVVLCILAVMLLGGIIEIVHSNKLYADLSSRLSKVERSMEQNEKHFDNPDTMQKMDEVMAFWEQNRSYVFVVGNHAIMRNLDEKLVTLKKQIEINADQDAPVTLAIVMNYVSELSIDSIPKIVNIF